MGESLPAARPVLRVGCPQWNHGAWVGTVSRPGAGPAERLAAYSSWCNTVEGNTTFYAVPSTKTVAVWAANTEASFRFLFKLPRAISHDARLRACDDDVAAFLERLDPLGERVERLWIQLPPSFGPGDLGVLESFLDRWAGDTEWAVELRHPAFFERGSAAEQAAESVLRNHFAEWVRFDTTVLFAEPPRTPAEHEGWRSKPRVGVRARALTDEPVIRYIGRDDDEATIAGWQRWVPVVAKWLHDGRTPTFFVHTPANDRAPQLARRFHAEVAALVTDLQPLPEPTQLPVPAPSAPLDPPTLF